MPTLRDVAHLAGVSPAVVSRVINRDETLRISETTRSRVVEALSRLDYVPNAAARSLRLARSGLVAVIVHDVTNPVYAEILRGLQAGAEASGRIVLVSESPSAERSSLLLDLVAGGGVDGLVLQGAGEPLDEVLARVARGAVPTVLLQSAIEGTSARLMSLPDRQAARMATAHLLALGHTRLAAIATPAGLSFTEARREGWRDALREGMGEAGLDDPEEAIAFAPSTMEGGARAARDVLARAPGTTGLVCFNALAALGALRSAEEAGRRVPDDLSIVAVHDLPLADLLRVPLTVVRMPLYEMGRQAMDLLWSDEADAVTMVGDPPPELVVRASTAPPA